VAIDITTGERKDLRDGLRSVPKQEKVVWDLGDPLEVEIVKRIFVLKVAGRGLVAIADILNSENIPCPKRGRWRNTDQKWSSRTILTLLRNPSYTGERVYNRLSFSKFVAKEKGLSTTSDYDRVKIVNNTSEWIVVPSAHPPIISKSAFVDANRGQDRPVTKPNQHYYKSTYLLTGLIKCSHCSFNFQGHHHKPSGRKYYVDGGFVNKGKSVCGWFSIGQDLLEKFVIQGVKATLLGPGIQGRVEQCVEELLGKETASSQSEERLREMKIQETKDKIANLLVLAEKGVHMDSLAGRIQELEKQLQGLQTEVTSNTTHPGRRMDRSKIKQLVSQFFNNFEEHFDKAPIMEKKELLRKVVDRITVDRETRAVNCYIKRIPTLEEVPVLKDQTPILLGAKRSANGNRTRISALRGLRPNR
jgi:site-specific DNA recombinase